MLPAYSYAPSFPVAGPVFVDPAAYGQFGPAAYGQYGSPFGAGAATYGFGAYGGIGGGFGGAFGSTFASPFGGPLGGFGAAAADNKPYKLFYFPIKAKASLPLLVLEFGKLPYEFKPITFEEWPEQKEKLNAPFGQLPLLQIFDRQVAQSTTIARVLAKDLNILGEGTNFATSDSLIEQMEDVWKETMKSNPTIRSADVPEGFDKFWNEYIPTQFSYLVKLLHGDRFTDNLTLGELAVFNMLNLLLDIRENLLENYAELRGFYDRIAAIPNVAAYIRGESGPQLQNYLQKADA